MILTANPLCGQIKEIKTPSQDTAFYRIQLHDGSVFLGSIINRNTNNIVVKSQSVPRLEIETSKIKRIEMIDQASVKNGAFWFPTPLATRYLISPSAFNLKRGEGYYQNTLLFLNSFNVGVTDNISIGGGFEFLSTVIAGPSNAIFYVTPKISFDLAKNFHAGGGLLYVSIPGLSKRSEGRGGFGIVYGVGTYGTKEHNITGGIGWGFVQSSLSPRPVLSLSGMRRLSRKTAFVSENWFVPIDRYYPVFTYGIRFLGEGMALDLAFLNTPNIASYVFIGIPFVSFTVKFR